MKKWNFETIVRLLRECGAIALKYYDDPPSELKEDGSIVTCADREIERRLAREFDSPADGVYLIGEETLDTRGEAYIESALREIAWVVDPIDGTAPYACQAPEWGVSVGRMEHGVLTDGAVWFPAFGRGYATDGDRVVRFGPAGEPVEFPRTVGAVNAATPVCIAQRVLKAGRLTVPNQVFAWGSCVAAVDALIRGKLAAELHFCKLWDIGGFIPILSRLGFDLRFADGEPLDPDVKNGGSFQLAPGAKRWQLRDYLAVGATPERTQWLLANTRFPEETQL